MRTINWYLDEAKEKQGFKSDRQLGTAIGGAPETISKYRKYKAAPSPEKMVKLAELAEVPEEVALADLGYWTNFDTPAAPVYKKMSEIVANAVKYTAASVAGFAMVSAAFTSPADASEPRHTVSGSLYIMGNY